MRVPRLVGNLALSFGTITALGLVGEVGLRLGGYSAEAYRHTERVANGRRTLLLDCYPTNPRGYFDIDLRDPATRQRYEQRGIARVHEVVEHTPFAVERRYSSLRFRGPELTDKAPGVRRVVVIGDSFTEGMGVREQDAYPRVLEEVLNRTAASSQGWEVLNCGRRGWDFPAIHDTFEEVLGYEPDLVVYGMVLNDAEQTEGFAAHQAHLNDWILDRERMYRQERPEPRLLDSRVAALVRDRLHRHRVAQETSRWYRDLYSTPNREGWQSTQSQMRRMHRRIRERGGHLLVALWPLLVGVEGQYPFADVSATISSFCITAGIPFHDLLEGLSGRSSESLWVHPVDHHPNEVAHRLAAESLAPVVRELLSE